MEETGQLEIFVIPSFHWDRAWYEGFQKFRIRLLDAMDLLLDILRRRSEYKFTLDGQTTILEDYLELRPEKEEVLKQLVSEGRIAVGPWYVLPDEKIPSEEGHIRNLLMGRRIARAFGAVMQAGYTPDAFGHISQLPQILRGFGIGTAFFSRGILAGTLNTEFHWQSPDGSSVVAYNAVYDASGRLGLSEEYGLDYLVSEANRLAGKSATKVIAVMANTDHLEPRESVVDIVNKAHATGLNVGIATIDEMLDRVKEKGGLSQTHSGECPPPLANFRAIFLPGVLSTRTYLKQANSDAERAVLLAENLCTIAADLGEDYPAPFLRRAWRYVLQCHPHDDICGCSKDVVHRDDIYRLEQAREIADGLIRRSLDDKHPRAFEHIARHISTDAFPENRTGLIVYNRLGWDVSGLVRTPLKLDGETAFHLLDPSGNQVPCAVNVSGREAQVEFLAAVPSCGYATFIIVKGEPPVGQQLVSADGSTIESELLRVTAREDGSLDILDKTTGEIYTGCNIFIDDEDAGDTYNQSRCENPVRLASTSFNHEIASAESTGLSACLTLRCTMRVPASLTADGKSRSPDLVDMAIVSKVALEPGSKMVRFATTIDNTARDHRLTCAFPTGVNADTCHAEGHFDIMQRPTVLPDEIYPRYNLRNYVAVHSGPRGAALIPDGLCEYEATKGPDGNVSLYLTLLRCVGYLSHKSPQGVVAGPVIETPEAQCLGTHTFKYAFMPCGAEEFSEGLCFRTAYEHNNPLIAHPITRHSGGTLPLAGSFVSVPEGLILTALKRGEENRDHTYIRVWNPGEETVEGALAYFRDVARAYETGLDEEPRGELPVQGRNVRISVAPKQILTVQLMLA